MIDKEIFPNALECFLKNTKIVCNFLDNTANGKYIRLTLGFILILICSLIKVYRYS